MDKCSTCRYKHTMGLASSRCNGCVCRSLYRSIGDSKTNPNIAFRDKNRRKQSFTSEDYDSKDTYIISVEGMSNLLTHCPVCKNSMTMDVSGSSKIDIKAIRCEDCVLEEMGQ